MTAMCKKRLDARDRFPSGMEEYLSLYGWHFSKKMCEFAISDLKDQNGNRMTMTKEQVDVLLANAGVLLDHKDGYDYVYAAAWLKSILYGSSILDETRLATAVKDYMDGRNSYEEMTFTHFYADCIGKGTVVIWEDML